MPPENKVVCEPAAAGILYLNGVDGALEDCPGSDAFFSPFLRAKKIERIIPQARLVVLPASRNALVKINERVALVIGGNQPLEAFKRRLSAESKLAMVFNPVPRGRALSLHASPFISCARLGDSSTVCIDFLPSEEGFALEARPHVRLRRRSCQLYLPLSTHSCDRR
jgi:hypothetical protein